MNRLLIALAALLAIFGARNTDPVRVRPLAGGADTIPRTAVVLASALVVLVAVYLPSLRGRRTPR